MKSNFQLKVTIFILFFSFWGLKPTWGQEKNCGNRIEVINTVPTTIDQNGELEISVEANDSFECQLFKVSGEGKMLKGVEERNGSGIIVFNDLEEGYYKILVKFSGEENPLCQLQQIAGISITKE